MDVFTVVFPGRRDHSEDVMHVEGGFDGFRVGQHDRGPTERTTGFDDAACDALLTNSAGQIMEIA